MAPHRTVPVVTGGEGPHTQGTFSERLHSVNCQHGARENLHIWGEFASEMKVTSKSARTKTTRSDSSYLRGGCG